MESQSAMKCVNGCGFYGSSSYEGMCSKCFKEKLKRQMSVGHPSIVLHNNGTVENQLANLSGFSNQSINFDLLIYTYFINIWALCLAVFDLQSQNKLESLRSLQVCEPLQMNITLIGLENSCTIRKKLITGT